MAGRMTYHVTGVGARGLCTLGLPTALYRCEAHGSLHRGWQEGREEGGFGTRTWGAHLVISGCQVGIPSMKGMDEATRV